MKSPQLPKHLLIDEVLPRNLRILPYRLPNHPKPRFGRPTRRPDHDRRFSLPYPFNQPLFTDPHDFLVERFIPHLPGDVFLTTIRKIGRYRQLMLPLLLNRRFARKHLHSLNFESFLPIPFKSGSPAHPVQYRLIVRRPHSQPLPSAVSHPEARFPQQQALFRPIEVNAGIARTQRLSRQDLISPSAHNPLVVFGRIGSIRRQSESSSPLHSSVAAAAVAATPGQDPSYIPTEAERASPLGAHCRYLCLRSLASQLGSQLRPARTHRNHLPQRPQTRDRRVRNP